MEREQTIEALRDSSKVTYLSSFEDGRVLLHCRDQALVAALVKKGGYARWFDRTMYSTEDGAEPDMQAEVTLGTRFFEEAQ